jgi:hypothetical protein
MSNATDRPVPSPPAPAEGGGAGQDPADFGTAYGMEMSIESPKGGSPEDLNDPLGWIRRWVERHKPA